MRRLVWLTLLAALAAGTWWTLAGRGTGENKPAAKEPVARPATSAGSPLIVAAGRVEPASEEILIASELDGRLRRVAVERPLADLQQEPLHEQPRHDATAPQRH